jgi:hypothetical protein
MTFLLETNRVNLKKIENSTTVDVETHSVDMMHALARDVISIQSSLADITSSQLDGVESYTKFQLLAKMARKICKKLSNDRNIFTMRYYSC